VLDGDAMTHAKPSVELFVGSRPDFIPAQPGAKQIEGTL
jgi:hypothetical protein